MKQSRDYVDTCDLTIRYEEKHCNPAVKGEPMQIVIMSLYYRIQQISNYIIVCFMTARQNPLYF